MKNALKKIFLILVVLSSIQAQSELKKIKIGLHWLPQAQFAGYYVGVENQIYKKYGFDVEIFHASPNETSQDMLFEKKLDFVSMFLSTAMILRSYDYELVNVCQLSQKSAQLFVTKRNANKKDVTELNGKKIGIWRSGFQELPTAFVKNNNLDVEFVLLSSSINLFLHDGIDAMTTMWYNEYHTILNSGYNPEELNTFFFADYGLDVPEDGLYCVKENYNKDMADKFVKATLEAWNYAFEHPDESIALVEKEMTKKNIAFNKAHQTWMFNRINDLFNVKEKKYKPGQLLKNDFQKAMDIFSSLKEIKKPFSYDDFFFGTK